jgi:CRP-like cAMP-binding protein
MLFTSSELTLLSKLFLFRGMDREELQKTLENADCYRKEYAKKQIIYHPHEYERSMGVLLSGSVEVTKLGDPGHPMIVSVLTEGEAFGGAALFNEFEEYTTTITAREPTLILFFPQDTVAQFIQDPQLALNYISYLSGRIHFLSQKIDSLIAGTGERKVAQYLLAQMEGNRQSVRLTCSLTDLADRLHIGRASLYRAFDHMEAQKILEKKGRTIQVLDRDKLSLV